MATIHSVSLVNMKFVIATAIFFLAYAVTVQGIGRVVTKSSLDSADIYSQLKVQSSYKTCSFWSNLVPSPVVTLKADNGKYLSRINRGGVNYIEAAKASPDVYCEFKAIRVDENSYAFVGDNGKYLSRVYRYGISAIEAAKSEIDVYSRFEVSLLASDLVTLKADNGLYLSRINYGSGLDPIVAAKSSADVFSQFTVNIVKFA